MNENKKGGRIRLIEIDQLLKKMLTKSSPISTQLNLFHSELNWCARLAATNTNSKRLSTKFKHSSTVTLDIISTYKYDKMGQR
jgi:hypothetical protein